MVKTDFEAFLRELRTTGGYRTADDHRAAMRKHPSGWVTFCFSLAVARVFPLSGLYEAFRSLTTEKWARFCFSTVTTPEACGMSVSVEGFADRLAFKGPVMYLANHMSTYETIALPPILHAFGPFSLVAKNSLLHLPFLSRAAVHMRLIGLGRTNPKADLLKLYEEGGRRIAGGDSFLIFPQGTRQEVFSRKRFSSIGAKLAERAGVPIVPIAVDTRCLPTRKAGFLKKVFRDFGPVDTSRDVRIAAGPVIPCGKAREMHEASFDWIASKLESWGLQTERN